MSVRSITVATAVSLTVAGAAAAPAEAAPDALRTYVVPGENVAPFGVDVFAGRLYVSGAYNGVVYRGDVRHRRVSVLVGRDVTGGSNAVKATPTRLLVTHNGEGPPRLSVYKRGTGQLVATFSTGRIDSFLPFVAVTPDGDAYVAEANSSDPALFRIPAAALEHHRAGIQPLQVFRSLRNTPIDTAPGEYNPRGLVATPDGRYLILGNRGVGGLFRVRLSDKQVTRIDTHGADLSEGFGLALTQSRVLYVARPFNDLVAEIRLSSDYSSGRLVSQTHNPRFNGPIGIAIAGDRLLAANFLADPSKPFTVVSIPLP